MNKRQSISEDTSTANEPSKLAVSTSGTIDCKPKQKKKPPPGKFARFLQLSSLKVFRRGKVTETIVPSEQGYELSSDYLY